MTAPESTEIKYIRHAAHATDKAVEAAFKAIKTGASELDIAAEAASSHYQLFAS